MKTAVQELAALPIDISVEVKRILWLISYNFYCILQQTEIGTWKAEETVNHKFVSLQFDIPVEVKRNLL